MTLMLAVIFILQLLTLALVAYPYLRRPPIRSTDLAALVAARLAAPGSRPGRDALRQALERSQTALANRARLQAEGKPLR